MSSNKTKTSSYTVLSFIVICSQIQIQVFQELDFIISNNNTRDETNFRSRLILNFTNKNVLFIRKNGIFCKFKRSSHYLKSLIKCQWSLRLEFAVFKVLGYFMQIIENCYFSMGLLNAQVHSLRVFNIK
ncbi:hypothetical protein TTHERM_000735229 (macronuclear) [Tetrahymena thermophila SB210]|uniref:Uncharacterized protein n=1 Tax=Tetrahymena thermophila (strain SB210) TaxID=312017 RepID=W7X8B6_TETTS|nr:hypothetical protein TTHERM_000735229 [Tetrahymena thermophila SB210]EWS75620.1 hypothetical protein TTHERM_000735229 [Tetrahymena thermophila SB210]|eukprot:XP_012651839.1 hypothetical protein TTHERM_000735229 [Tetrahymena thermophila SB210]